MKIILYILITLFIFISPIKFTFAEDEKQTMVDVRQQAMQAMWTRLDRLATLIALPGDAVTSSDGSTIIISNQNKMEPLETYSLIHAREAEQDGIEIYNLLSQVEDFWPRKTSVAHVKSTNAERLVWIIPEAFNRYYSDAVHASRNLNKAFEEENPESIKRSVCMLALSCGRCHAAFRKVRFDNLKKEGRGWTGNYTACWSYKNEVTLNSSAIRE
tara:strand:+ start:530 stop:1174 length:645 start_codon:yes stop_codon:yes gene_type:complete